MIPLIGQSWRRADDSAPRSLKEFTELLSQAEPKLYVVPATSHCPKKGVWVSQHPLSDEEASWLLRVPEHAHRWQGIALCEMPIESFLTPDEVRESWGELHMQLGPILCFGDPVLLRRIHTAILDKKRTN
jgi:hypothetical protein